MAGPTPTNGEGTVPCEVCMKDVPLSQAKREETSDYVRHFCGLECYTKWREQAGNKNKDNKSS